MGNSGDGIRKGALVVRRKPLAVAYFRQEDKPAEQTPEPPEVWEVLAVKGQRVQVRMPPSDAWPKGLDGWWNRDDLKLYEASCG